MTKLNKLFTLGLIFLSMFLWACSGGTGGTSDGDIAASPAESPPVSGDTAAPDSGAVNETLTPRDLTLDSSANRALVIDPERKAVIAIDLASGASSILSDSAKPDSANTFEDPRGIAVDESGSRALVVDAARKAIIAVDLTTGARSVFSSNTAPSGQVLFNNPLGIVIDSVNSRALVADSGLQAVVAVDLSSGERTLLGSN